MRTIKFRGKCCHSDAWAYGNLVDYGEDECPEIQGFDVFHEGRDVWQEMVVERNTVGQFTGLHDKNDKEIYEGDIVKWEYPDYDSCTGWRGTVKNVCKVTFEYGSFRINAYPYNLGSCEDFFEDKETYGLEVIGNIYDNPELPKGGKQ